MSSVACGSSPSEAAADASAALDATARDADSDSAGPDSGSERRQAGQPDAGPDTTGSPRIGPCPVFPADSPWNTDVSAAAVHVDSDRFIDSIGREKHLHPDFGTIWDGAPIGIPFALVDASQPAVPIVFTAYGDESDPGPYPVPTDAPIEGGASSDGDRHVLVVDTAACRLYELYRAFPRSDGSWEAASGAVFDLARNDHHPFSWTSADAAGLPIFPGLARYEEVAQQGEVRHALRFTVSRSRRAVVAPARHYASSNDDPALPPMGLRLRMKASYDCGAYSSLAQVLCRGLKRYGMIVADNGSDWYISGAPDGRWDDDALGDLKRVPGDAFEVVHTGPIETY